jgi:hypothetical protein
MSPNSHGCGNSRDCGIFSDLRGMTKGAGPAPKPSATLRKPAGAGSALRRDRMRRFLARPVSLVRLRCLDGAITLARCYISFGSGLPGRALTSQHPTDAVISPTMARGLRLSPRKSQPSNAAVPGTR